MPNTNALQSLHAIWPGIAICSKSSLEVDSISTPNIVEDELSLNETEVTHVLPDLIETKVHGRKADAIFLVV